jgi:hypothetical protein
MSRTKSLKRKRRAVEEAAHKANNITQSPSNNAAPNDPKSVQAVVLEEDLEITVETLETLAKHPSLIKSKACKDLRVAVYDFRQACTTGMNTAEDSNLTSRITAALTDSKYTDALVLLAEMAIRKDSPKLGALCRWVRDLDVVSGLSMRVDGVARHPSAMEWSAEDRERLRVLAAILKVSGPTDTSPEGLGYTTNPIRVLSSWDLRNLISKEAQTSTTTPPRSPVPSDDIKGQFRIIETTPGPQRKPPNLHPQILHASHDNAIPLTNTPPPPTTLHHHPTVPNLSLLTSVLTPSECGAIISAASTIGFTPDAPLTTTHSNTSTLAHNFVWIIDPAFSSALWSRIAPHIPSHVNGRRVRGLNRRFRVYRYVPGAEYRCHIDGAWPPSSIHPLDDSYIYDASPVGQPQSSLYTFLLYLNDDFDRGETTFFMPALQDGVMNAFPLKPVAGAAALFPHGEGKGALLHEGSGVTCGVKFIVRTDVLYDVEPEA